MSRVLESPFKDYQAPDIESVLSSFPYGLKQIIINSKTDRLIDQAAGDILEQDQINEFFQGLSEIKVTYEQKDLGALLASQDMEIQIKFLSNCIFGGIDQAATAQNIEIEGAEEVNIEVFYDDEEERFNFSIANIK